MLRSVFPGPGPGSCAGTTRLVFSHSGDSSLEPFTAFSFMGGHIMALPFLVLWVAFSPSTLVQFQWVAIQTLPLSVRVTLGPSSVITPHFSARTNCAVEAHHEPLMGN